MLILFTHNSVGFPCRLCRWRLGSIRCFSPCTGLTWRDFGGLRQLMAGWSSGPQLEWLASVLCAPAFLRLVGASPRSQRDPGGREDNIRSSSTCQTSASSHLLGVLLAKSHHRVKARFKGGRDAPWLVMKATITLQLFFSQCKLIVSINWTHSREQF